MVRCFVIVLLSAAWPLIAVPTSAQEKPEKEKAGPPQAAGESPVIVVEANYPGASALVVADTVGTPIEHQVNGVEGSVQLMSRCNNDGTYILVVTFKPGADLDKAQKLVQNRVALAVPMLPEEVKRGGVTIRKKSPLRMLVSLTSAEGKYDTLYLSNYAALQIKDELARVAGVGEVTGLGLRTTNMRIWFDPARLQARNLSPKDVVDAIRQQNVQVLPGRIGQPPADKGKDLKYDLSATDRLTDAKEFENIILKTDGKGAEIRLKDVARVEVGAAIADDYVTFNGKPGVLLCVYPTGAAKPKDLSRAIAVKITTLRARAPEGVQLEVAFDFTANLETPGGSQTAEYLLLDLDFPDGSSIDRKRGILERCEKLLRETAGVQDILALTESPFDILQRPPGILVRLAPADKRKVARAEMMRTIRKELEKLPDAVVRLRDLSRLGGFPRCGYPIDLAVRGPADGDAKKLREVAKMFAERLQQSKKLADVWANPESALRPRLDVAIDRTKAKDSGVSIDDILSTLEVTLGPCYVNDFNRFGRNWQVTVQADEKFRMDPEALKVIGIRNRQGKLIPLTAVATVEMTSAPAAIHRVDMMPIQQITANPAADVSLGETRKLCESLFDQLQTDARLSTEYRLTWPR